MIRDQESIEIRIVFWGSPWAGLLSQPRRSDSFQKEVKLEVSCGGVKCRRNSVIHTRRNRCKGKEVRNQLALHFIPQVLTECLLGSRRSRVLSYRV